MKFKQYLEENTVLQPDWVEGSEKTFKYLKGLEKKEVQPQKLKTNKPHKMPKKSFADAMVVFWSNA
jgi:hypothetical protein